MESIITLNEQNKKINNLRCAFRHQLKKYTEFKSKTGREEPYCPKRRYFESLMFLMEEENITKNIHLVEGAQEFKSLGKSKCFADIQAFKKASKHDPEREELISSKDQINTIDEPINHKDISNDIYEGDNELHSKIKQPNVYTDLLNNKSLSSNTLNQLTWPDKNTDVLPMSTDTPVHTSQQSEDSIREIDEKSCKNGSVSVSSHISNESESFSMKCLKVDCTSKDFQKLLTLACYNIDKTLDDSFSNFGKIVAQKLRSLTPQQAFFAEKLISDVLFQGHLGLLSASNIENFTFCQ